MKKIFVISSLIFLPPMLAEGRAPTIVPPPIPGTAKPFRPTTSRPGSTTAVGEKPVSVLEFPGCIGPCVVGLESLLASVYTPAQAKKVAQKINRNVGRVPGAHVQSTSEVIQALPAVSASLQKAGFSPTKATQTVSSIFAAVIEQDKWNDPVASQNLAQFAKDIAADPREHLQKIEEVRRNCELGL